MVVDASDLFLPFELAGVVLPSRFVMPAMQRLMCRDGAPTPVLADYYRRRGEGGVGMVITESCAVDHPSAWGADTFARLDRTTRAAWRDCITEVVGTGAAMLVQLWHEGAVRDATDGLTLSPSGLAAPGIARGRSADAADIAEIVQAFRRSACMAQEAGASGVEIHAAHGYLLDQFLWPATNLRSDLYGGPDITKRARLLTEIVEAIRTACGAAFIVSVRFSQWKERDYGARIVEDVDELTVFTRLLRAAGASILHCSTRRYWESEWPHSPRGLAGWTREVSGLPTIAVGSFGLDRDVMESFLREDEAAHQVERAMALTASSYEAGEFDLLAIGRGLIADPQLIAKLKRGDYDAIVPFRRELVTGLVPSLH